jgi:chromosome segregation ATPase
VQDKKQAEALDKAAKALADSIKKINAASSNAKDAKGKIEQKIIVLKQLQDKLQDEQQAVTHKLLQDEKIRTEIEGRLREALTQDSKELKQVRVIRYKSALETLSGDKTAADRTAIRKQVEKLSAELQEKRVELAAAQKRLSELEHQADGKSPQAARITKSVTRPPVFGVVKPDDPTNRVLELHVGPDGKAIGSFVGKLQSSDQKRIDELEKKLQKLLEEVASLKKEKTSEK